jgi:hypothetical protein
LNISHRVGSGAIGKSLVGKGLCHEFFAIKLSNSISVFLAFEKCRLILNPKKVLEMVPFYI